MDIDSLGSLMTNRVGWGEPANPNYRSVGVRASPQPTALSTCSETRKREIISATPMQ
jgi:hypothetical protein